MCFVRGKGKKEKLFSLQNDSGPWPGMAREEDCESGCHGGEQENREEDGRGTDLLSGDALCWSLDFLFCFGHIVL